jgi:hypothetical protein
MTSAGRGGLNKVPKLHTKYRGTIIGVHCSICLDLLVSVRR